MNSSKLFVVFMFFSLVGVGTCFADTQVEYIQKFNSIAENNISNGNDKAYISLKCGNVDEAMSFISNGDKASLILEVNSDKSGRNTYKSSMYGLKLANDLKTKLGWEYYFGASRGKIVVTLEKNGNAYTEVSVLHGDGYRKIKSKCKIENLIE